MKTYTAEEAGRIIYQQLKAEGREDVIDFVIELAEKVRATAWKHPAGELVSIQPYLQEGEA